MIGTTVSHYQILEIVGEGGMGVVYKAHDSNLDRMVALKFLPPHLTVREDSKKRFIREAKAIAALNHPNICTVHEIGETEDGQLYIVMPCYEGISLKEKIKDGPLPIDEALNVTIQIAKGLAEAHKKGIIHRDIKPANILVDENNQPIIVDFGLAKLADQTLMTKEGTTLGTVAYMSPEQSQGSHVDHRTDIWALGVVLYELLTGERPFEGEYEQAVIYSIMNEEPVAINKIRPEVPDKFVKIVKSALQKEADQRYSSAQKMLDDLEILYLERISTSRFDFRLLLLQLKKPYIALSFAAVLVLIAVGIAWFVNRQQNIQWAKQEALPEIERLVDVNWSDYTDAYALAVHAEQYIPDDPELSKYFDQSSVHLNINTEPQGASIYVKEYDQPESKWNYLGESPLDSVRLPVGIFRWKIEKEGYEPVLAAATTWAITTDTLNNELKIDDPNHFSRKLDIKETIPKGMVRVRGRQTPVGFINDFFIDKYEVTNRQFKEFVDAGGYQTKKYWTYPFLKNEEELTWEEAMMEFVDQTNRPGPATWQAGTYLDGQENYPVSGVSWYEAAAYAAWAGKSLPTSKHWGLARGEGTQLIRWPQLGGYAVFAPFSNFRGEGAVTVGSLPGYTSYGAHDMAGNVREWCFNNTSVGRVLRGGAWNSNTYFFTVVSHAPPFDRSEINGFRTVYYPHEGSIPDAAFAEIEPRTFPDFYEIEPVSDEVFQVYKQQFAYDSIPLNSRIVARDTTAEFWDYEMITYDAVYNNERIIGHLFLPKNAAPPYQTVIYFPGGASINEPTSKNIAEYYEFPVFLSFLVKNGRAVLYPVYKGTFERSNDFLTRIQLGNRSHQYSEFVIQFVQDFKRSLDYLETRDDIYSEKIAYYGMSWGGLLGAIIPAVEERVKLNILIGGFLRAREGPEVSQINYVSRVKVPTLMLNGRYDSREPFDLTIKPMFDLLGTPEEDKKLLAYETDHIPPKIEYMKEILNWLDLYFGEVGGRDRLSR